MASASSYSNLVQELYISYFGRPADYFGLQNFEAALAAANAPIDPAALAAAYSTNAAVKTLVDSFGTSAESTALYGTGSTESFVNAIFENLFGRPAAVSGLTFWTNAIESGQVSQGDAALAILAGSEPTSNSSSQATDDWNLVKAKVAVASNFTTALGTSSTQIVDYSGATAAQDARLMLASVTATTDTTTFNVQTTINNIVAGNSQNTFNLTTGVDTLVGGPGNNTFNAVLDANPTVSGGQAATLQSFDTITGGTLNNTLNITDFGTGSWMTIPSGATITGITTLNINSLEGIAGTTSPGFSFSSALDLTSWTDLTALNIKSSDNYYNIVSVGDNVAVNIVTSGPSSEYVLTFGGSTVNVSNTSTEYTYNYITGGASTSSVSVSGSAANEEGSETYVYDLHNSGNKGYDGNGTTPGWSAGTNSITTFNAVNQTDDSDNYIYSDALSTINLTDSSYDYTYVSAAAGTRALTINLSNDGNSTYYTGEEVYLEDLSATSATINATGTAIHGLSLYLNAATALTFNDAVDVNFYDGTTAGSDYLTDAAAKTVTITGAGAFTADLSGLGASTVIDASGSSGKVTVEMGSAWTSADAAQSFTGGTGQDIVTVGASQTGTIAAGGAGDNEIILANAPAATQANLASYANFSILGVSGSTSGVFDMGKLSNGASYTSFDVQGSGGNVTFTNAANTASLTLENGNSHVITLQTSDATGVADTANVTLGTTTEGGNTYAQVTLEDSALFGTGTVNLTSNVSSASSANTLTSLSDKNIVTLNVSGTGFVDIGTISSSSTAVTINNSAVATGTESLNIGTLSDVSLATLTLTGSEGIYIDTLSSPVTSLTIIDNNTSEVEIGTLADTALTSATFTNSVNTTSGTFTIDGTLSEPSLVTLNLNGNVALSITGDTVATGITVAGGTDNAHVTIDFAEATASGSTDSITLGNGAGDSVTLGAGLASSTQTIVLGSGAGDSIVTTTAGAVNATVGSATTGTDTITADSASSLHATAGNGTNVISDTAAGAAIAITVGTGANTISVGDNTTGTINLGAHAATVADAITIGVSGTSLTAIEKIGGLNNSGLDTLTFTGDPSTLTFTQVTAAAVDGFHGNTTQLSDWIAAATGESGSGITGTAHSVMWFTFQNNTYLVETVGADSGTLATGDTVVELTGTAYTFAHATTAGGIVHLMS